MISPSIGRQKARRNRTKIYACTKHSVLIFTNISDKKIFLSYNSIDKKMNLEQCSTDKGEIVYKTFLIQAFIRNITII